jgi:AraC-like DNA-binding protein
MKHAAELLATGDYAVADVAFKVGYTHPTNFTHAFKKFYGSLPGRLTTRSRPPAAAAVATP